MTKKMRVGKTTYRILYHARRGYFHEPCMRWFKQFDCSHQSGMTGVHTWMGHACAGITPQSIRASCNGAAQLEQWKKLYAELAAQSARLIIQTKE